MAKYEVTIEREVRLVNVVTVDASDEREAEAVAVATVDNAGCDGQWMDDCVVDQRVIGVRPARVRP